MSHTKAFTCFILICLSTIGLNSAWAQDNVNITRLAESDIRFFDKQLAQINDLAKMHLGRQLRNEAQNDLDVLQALLNKNIVKQNDTLLLQAMGVALGALYIKELGVHWVVYRDTKGRSRALQWNNSKHVLFPITMISRRVSAGIKVDTHKLYQQGKSELMRVIKDENRRQMLKIQ